MFSLRAGISTAVSVPFVLCLLLTAGCGSEQTRWEEAKGIDSASAYEEFLSRHPDGVYADSARARVQHIHLHETKGEVKGILVSTATNEPLGMTPNLWRDEEAGEDQEEIRRLMDAVESIPGSTGSFHFVNVPPGHYFLFTRQHGIIGEGFDIRTERVVDLGRVQVGNNP